MWASAAAAAALVIPTRPTPAAPASTAKALALALAMEAIRLTAALIGGTIGYNWQVARWVYGFEGD